MCRLRNIAMQCDYRTDRQTADKVIRMCGYASQATQKCDYVQINVTRYKTDMSEN